MKFCGNALCGICARKRREYRRVQVTIVLAWLVPLVAFWGALVYIFAHPTPTMLSVAFVAIVVALLLMASGFLDAKAD